MSARDLARGRAARILRRAADLVPVTWRGALLASLSALGLWRFGLGASDLVLFVLGCTGLALVACSLAMVVPAAIYWRRRVRPDEATALGLECGTPIRTGFQVPALSFLPTVRLDWEWIDPPGVQVRVRRAADRLAEESVASRRCLQDSIVRRFAVADVFGLAKVSWRTTAATPITILPHVGRLRSVPVLRSLGGGEGIPRSTGTPDGDRIEIRRYVPGDPVRSILWRSFAKTRSLNVRLPERTISPTRRTFAYLVTGSDDEAAAGAARAAIESGALGDEWTFSADGSEEPADDRGKALEQIARSGSATPSDGTTSRVGIEAFVDRLAHEVGFHCVVFAPARAGKWLERCLALSERHPGMLSFVLATDGWDARAASSRWKKLLLRDAGVEPPVGDPTPVFRQLARAGAAVLIANRADGRVHSRIGRSGVGAVG
jgi:hypothetical protein